MNWKSELNLKRKKRKRERQREQEREENYLKNNDGDDGPVKKLTIVDGYY